MITRRSFGKALASSAMAAPLVTVNASAQSNAPKIGFVYLGPIGDYGWTYQHDVGRKEVLSAFGDRVTTTYVENVPETADAERVIADLANKGHALIFTTSFGYMNPTIKVAPRFPKTFFEHCTGYKRAANVGTYNIRFYEARYVLGKIAGAMSKTGTIGFVCSVPIPEIAMGVNAAMLGAQSVNPKMRAKLIFINSWYDPGKEGDAAKALFDQGCDILLQHTDSPAPLQVAEQRGFKSFGGSADMITFAPKGQLSAAISNWGPYYVERVRALLEGSWAPDARWGGFDTGMIQMAPYRNMPDAVAASAAKAVEDIKSGKLKVFEGPIKDQTGTMHGTTGASLTDAEIGGMKWLVDGVDGRLPA